MRDRVSYKYTCFCEVCGTQSSTVRPEERESNIKARIRTQEKTPGPLHRVALQSCAGSYQATLRAPRLPLFGGIIMLFFKADDGNDGDDNDNSWQLTNNLLCALNALYTLLRQHSSLTRKELVILKRKKPRHKELSSTARKRAGT